MKLLFIDHECHKKTRSAEFFLAVVRKVFDVVEHYYSHYYRTGAQKAGKDCDIAVIWEFPISRWRFLLPGKRNVFVPMYDNEWASYWQWKRIAWSGMGVVSFCDKVTEHARRCGVANILNVRYFPDPASLPKTGGDPKRVFLWERGEIDRRTAEILFPPSEGYVFDIKRRDEFLEREDYLRRIARCEIMIAPRRKEGIGMVFLEAMAMGKCVVANDDATMNEYIKDGENGILFSFDRLAPISGDKIARARANVPGSAARLRARWRRDAERINDFLFKQQPCVPSFANRMKLTLSYPLFLAEGVLHVLAERCSAIKPGGR
ncbi:MAG: glycosyltransferase [Kiritimatiellae bacterium]|nr:glycosyltransferase [Kiritimatiellia bacterium]